MEESMELALRRQADEALRQALSDPEKAILAVVAYQMIIEGRSEAEVRAALGEKFHPPKRDLAEERRVEVERSFRNRGIAVSVPKPAASNRDFARWEKEGKALFFRPATADLSYEAFMVSYGQGGHWTVTDEAERAKIGWEKAAAGYWFLAEIAAACPRAGTSWNGLTGSIRLLSLEEYVITYWTHRDITGERIDVDTWCWLRTRFGLGALNANVNDGEVYVGRNDVGDLSAPYGNGGGRAVEVVGNAAA